MKFNLTNRLYLGFIIAFILVIITGITSYKTYINQAYEQSWVEHTHRVINQLEELEAHVYEMRFAARNFLYTHDSSFEDRFNRQTSLIDTSISNLQEIVNDNQVQAQRMTVLKNEIHQLVTYLKNTFSQYTSVSQQDILSIGSAMEPQLDEISRQFLVLMSEERRLLAERESKNQSLLDTAVNILLINIVLTLLIITILIVFIFSELKRRRNAEEETKLNLKALQELNSEINKRNWMLTGLTQLNTTLQSEGTVTELCESVLKILLQYLELPAGAFYTVMDDVRGLHLLACVGTTENINRTFSEKHMLGAHVLNEKRILVVKDIPANYWSVESALGKAQPGEIAFMPLIQNDSLLGIIELAIFKSFTSTQINFLEVTSKNIVIALQSAHSRRKIKNLLEELGQQRDELLNQQEELYKTNEEMSRQTEALQKSEEELRVQEEELRKTNDELRNKNDSVEVARHALALKNTELQNAVKYKSEFLANMSHELRTPLNSILILGKQLMENKGKNLTEKQVEYSRIIYKSGTDLLELINDLLDLSKIEAGKVDLHLEEISLADVEQDMKELFDIIAKERELKFITHIDPSAPKKIISDQQRLEQIIKNLLSNSFKFTPKGGAVRLAFSAADEVDNWVSVSVSDSGIGIPQDKQALIFNAFQQADGSTSRKYGGTGLGLSICRELVKMLGGRIDLHSREGEGSTFTVKIPLTGPSEQKSLNQDTGESMELTPEPMPLKAQSVEDDRAVIIHHNEKVVLIIEDDSQFASLLRDFARDHGYKAVIAGQGDEGLILAKRYQPNAIILDIKLPVIDGWTVLKLLKDDPVLKQIPVHIITASDYNLTAMDNVVSYMRKPVDKRDIDNAFGSLMYQTLTNFKKILIFHPEDSDDNSLQQLLENESTNVNCLYAKTVDEAFGLLSSGSFDAIIADVGKDVQKHKSELLRLKQGVERYNIPVIVYIDSDISSSDELELMKASDVIIRESEMSRKRLMDELQLFLNKVKESEHNKEPAAPKDVPDNALENKKVLLVDDDMRNIFVLTHILEEYHMRVIPAVNGKDAIEELNKDPEIDIVIMDLMMPEMDGYEAIRKIRKDLHLTSLPVIALTAKAMTGDREKIIKEGASDYLSKPIDVNKLISLIRVWITR